MLEPYILWPSLCCPSGTELFHHCFLVTTGVWNFLTFTRCSRCRICVTWWDRWIIICWVCYRELLSVNITGGLKNEGSNWLVSKRLEFALKESNQSSATLQLHMEVCLIKLLNTTRHHLVYIQQFKNGPEILQSWSPRARISLGLEDRFDMASSRFTGHTLLSANYRMRGPLSMLLPWLLLCILFFPAQSLWKKRTSPRFQMSSTHLLF